MGKNKRKKPASPLLQKLWKQTQSNFDLQGKKVVFGEYEGEKMSEVIQKFIRPYLKHVDTAASRESLIGIAVIAWNVALASGPERKHLLAKITQTLNIEDEQMREDYYAIIGEMIRRKERYFAHNRRYIISYQVTDMPTQFHLAIASLVENPNSKSETPAQHAARQRGESVTPPKSALQNLKSEIQHALSQMRR
jgi:hypothetical protein